MIIDNSDEKKAATPFDPNSSGLQSSSGYAGHSTSQYAGSQSYGAPPSYEDARFIQSPPSGFPPAPQPQFGANNQYQTQGYPSMSSNNPFDGTAPYAPIPNTNPFLHKVQAGYPPQAQQRPSPPSGGYPNDFARGPGPSAAEVNERGFPISPFEQQQQDLLRGKSTGSPYSASPRGSSNTPEPSSSSASSSMFDKVKSFSPGGPTPNQLLNPPPPSFMRAPPTNLPYAPFPPTALVSFSSKLENGFPLLPPPATTSPHPFTLHDINEDDWKRFLTDVKAAGALSITTKFVSHAAPLAMRIRFFPGKLLMQYRSHKRTYLIS